MKQKKVLLNEKILTYYHGEHSNKTETFLFLHGWGQDGTSFREIYQKLDERNIPYIGLDLPGFGASQLRYRDMHIEDYGKEVIDFIEKLGLEKPIIIGHSFGGRICIYLGSHYDNLRKIVLIGAAGIQKPLSTSRNIIVKTAKALFSLPGLRKIGEAIKSRSVSRDYKNAGKLEQVFKNTISNDLQHYMKQIHLPTMMIRGDHDEETPVEQGKLTHGNIQSSEFHIVPGSHFVFQEEPDKVLRLILDFVNR